MYYTKYICTEYTGEKCNMKLWDAIRYLQFQQYEQRLFRILNERRKKSLSELSAESSDNPSSFRNKVSSIFIYLAYGFKLPGEIESSQEPPKLRFVEPIFSPRCNVWALCFIITIIVCWQQNGGRALFNGSFRWADSRFRPSALCLFTRTKEQGWQRLPS